MVVNQILYVQIQCKGPAGTRVRGAKNKLSIKNKQQKKNYNEPKA